MDILQNFVVFEGGDGSGTSTQLSQLAQKFTEKGLDNPVFYQTFEPTGGVIGRIIRSTLKNELNLRAETLARLFAADRNEHLYAPDGIVERCNRGELVVCDRYVFSSLVYQGIECGESLPRGLNAAFPAPQLLLFFDIEPQLALDRLSSRPSIEIYEHLEFQNKVRAGYHALLREYRDSGFRIEVINASQSVEKVAGDVWSAVSKLPILAMR